MARTGFTTAELGLVDEIPFSALASLSLGFPDLWPRMSAFVETPEPTQDTLLLPHPSQSSAQQHAGFFS